MIFTWKPFLKLWMRLMFKSSTHLFPEFREITWNVSSTPPLSLYQKALCYRAKQKNLCRKIFPFISESSSLPEYGKFAFFLMAKSEREKNWINSPFYVFLIWISLASGIFLLERLSQFPFFPEIYLWSRSPSLLYFYAFGYLFSNLYDSWSFARFRRSLKTRK